MVDAFAPFRPLRPKPPLEAVAATAEPRSGWEDIVQGLAAHELRSRASQAYNLAEALRMGMTGQMDPMEVLPHVTQAWWDVAVPKAAGIRPTPGKVQMFIGPEGLGRALGVKREEAEKGMQKILSLGEHRAWEEGKLFRGAEGKPRMEIPDVLRTEGVDIPAHLQPKPGTTKGEVIGARMGVVPSMEFEYYSPALAHYFPKLREAGFHDIYKIPPIRVQEYPGKAWMGHHDPRTDVLTLNLTPQEFYSGRLPLRWGSGDKPANTPLSVAAHEIQHPIQTVEGWTPGGNVAKALYTEEYWKALNKKRPDLPTILLEQKRIGGPGIQPSDVQARKNLAFEIYRNMAGEVEARAVQQRMLNPMEYRIHPYETMYRMGYPIEKQYLIDEIIRGLGHSHP